jgi:hypothetical protein
MPSMMLVEEPKNIPAARGKVNAILLDFLLNLFRTSISQQRCIDIADESHSAGSHLLHLDDSPVPDGEALGAND